MEEKMGKKPVTFKSSDIKKTQSRGAPKYFSNLRDKSVFNFLKNQKQLKSIAIPIVAVVLLVTIAFGLKNIFFGKTGDLSANSPTDYHSQLEQIYSNIEKYNDDPNLSFEEIKESLERIINNGPDESIKVEARITLAIFLYNSDYVEDAINVVEDGLKGDRLSGENRLDLLINLNAIYEWLHNSEAQILTIERIIKLIDTELEHEYYKDLRESYQQQLESLKGGE